MARPSYLGVNVWLTNLSSKKLVLNLIFLSSNPAVNIVGPTQTSIPQNDCLEGQSKNTVLVHVLHVISKNVLKGIANMGLMNHAKIKVEDSV